MPSYTSTVEHSYRGVSDSSPYPYWDEEVLKLKKLENDYNKYLSYMTPVQKMQYERTPEYAKKDFIDNIAAELNMKQAEDRAREILEMEDETNKALQMYGVSAESGLSSKKSDLKGLGNFLLGESKPVARSTSEYAYEKLLNSGKVTDGQVQVMNAVRNIAGTAPEIVFGLISGGAGNAAMIAGDAGRIYDSLIREGYEPYGAAKVATVLTANDAIWRKGLSTLPGITDGRSVITKALPSGNALTRTIGRGASGFAEGSGRELTEQMIINAMTGEPDDIDWGRVFESGFDEGVENAVFSVPGELAGVYGTLENGGNLDYYVNQTGINSSNIVYGSNTKTSQKLSNQILTRGWSKNLIGETVDIPFTIRKSINKATGNTATVFYTEQGSYVIIDDVTKAIVQVSNNNDPLSWKPDESIIDPYIPKEDKNE
ncbi:MAG: hypothetical protein E7235_05600 [Lachnospiraceae bacterium]|nr:hypothetical protein [Lachnospiraceae bacterium]